MTRVRLSGRNRACQAAAEYPAQEMPITPLMAYNVFTVCDETYFEGFPTAENPYTNPVPNWANTKYMFAKVKPKQA